MPAPINAAFGCPASLPAPCGCWLGLLGLGAAPAAYAAGLLLHSSRQRARQRRGEASDAKREDPGGEAESKLGDGSGGGSTSTGYQPLPPAAAADADAPAPPRRWEGVIKDGAWPGLFWREALIYVHIGYQLYRLLPLLGVLVAPSSRAGGGRSGDFWWGHNLVRFDVGTVCLCGCAGLLDRGLNPIDPSAQPTIQPTQPHHTHNTTTGRPPARRPRVGAPPAAGGAGARRPGARARRRQQ